LVVDGGPSWRGACGATTPPLPLSAPSIRRRADKSKRRKKMDALSCDISVGRNNRRRPRHSRNILSLSSTMIWFYTKQQQQQQQENFEERIFFFHFTHGPAGSYTDTKHNLLLLLQKINVKKKLLLFSFFPQTQRKREKKNEQKKKRCHLFHLKRRGPNWRRDQRNQRKKNIKSATLLHCFTFSLFSPSGGKLKEEQEEEEEEK
jgi:hypothetical protein